MTRETAQQRHRRHKRDPFRAAQIAPSHPMPPVKCVDCGDLRLIHNDPSSGNTACQRGCCGCTAYREATT